MYVCKIVLKMKVLRLEDWRIKVKSRLAELGRGSRAGCLVRIICMRKPAVDAGL